MNVISNKEMQKNRILHENMWKVMWQVSWPAIIAMVIYGLNSVFDAIFVGSYAGGTALAGVSLAYPLSQMTLGIGSLIGVGAGSALSIALGADNKRTQERIIGNVNYLSILLSLIFAVLFFIFAQPLVRFMGGEGEALSIGTEYFKITVLGSLFWVHGLACNMVVRAEGKMKSAAVMMGVGLVVNIFANYILVGLLHLGAAGAAWGTNLGMLVYTLMGLFYFKSGKASFSADPLKIYRDKDIVKSILSMGMSSMIMSVMSLLQAVVVFNALSGVGTTADIAFYGASYRIFTFTLTPLFGLMRALQPVAGINYGAQAYGRVIKSAKVFIISGTLLMLPFWLLLMIFPQTMLASMLPNVVVNPVNLMNFRIFMALLPLLPVVFMAMTFFPSINQGNAASTLGILRQLVLYVPLMLYLPKAYGVKWVYYGSTAIDVFVSIMTFLLFARTFRQLRLATGNAAALLPEK